MKTFLQSINDVTAQYITMPLQRFFLYATIGLWVILIVIALFTPLSLSKFMALIGLYGTSIITALLAYANYQLSRLDEMENIDEMPKGDSGSEINDSPEVDSAFVA
ncbi:MAG: hypothetical protein PHV10_01175 [Sulfuricurvum sp.]|nr:hypothetical protein [Sulfuricurvum sp.]